MTSIEVALIWAERQLEKTPYNQALNDRSHFAWEKVVRKLRRMRSKEREQRRTTRDAGATP